MITTNYENTYVSVQKARWDVIDLDLVMEVLSKASAPMSCRDIGLKIWGPAYLNNRRRAAHMGQMLRHLLQGSFIRWDEVKGDPIEVEYEKYIREDDKGNPPFIKVHDDEGNEYIIHNPKFNGYAAEGRLVKVKKTVIPTTKVYSLVR